MTTYTWRVTSGDYNSAANWTPIGVPGPYDTAIVGQGSANDALRLQLQVSAGSAGALQVAGAGTVVTLSSGFNDEANAGGGLFVSNGGTLVASGAIYNNIGNGGVGAAIVTGGGSVLDDLTSGTLVGYGGGSGFLTVSGGALAEFANLLAFGGSSGGFGYGTLSSGGEILANGFVIVGREGYGNLTISGGLLTTPSALSGGPSTVGLIVADSAGGIGSILVSGLNSEINLTNNEVYVGERGFGTLVVAGGGQVFAGSENSTLSAAFAEGTSSGATGSTTLTGLGTLLSASGFVYVGRGGGGSLIVANGATAILGATNEAVRIGAGSGTLVGGSGSLTVAGGGTFSAVETLDDGYGGSPGAIAVSSGGVILVGGQIGIGESSSGVGANGSGTFTIGAAGVVSAGLVTTLIGSNAAVFIGDYAGDSGTLLVSGAGAVLNTNGQRLNVGNGGTGTATVAAGGKIVAGSTSSSYPALRLGTSAGASGALTISSGGSVVAGGEVVVGNLGSGTLLVTGGGSFVESAASPSAATGFLIGNSFGGSGTVTVSGSGTILSVAELLEVGAAASGSLTVSSGAVVSAAMADIGGTSTGSGAVGVGGGQLIVGGAFTDGIIGFGTLTLTSGSLTSAGSFTEGVMGSVGGSGTLVTGSAVIGGSYAAGGVLSAGTVTVSGSLGPASGTLTVSGAIGGTGRLQIAQNADLVVTGPVSGVAAMFTGSAAILDIKTPTAFNAVISGYIGSDQILLAGLGASPQPTYSAAAGGSETALTFSNGAQLLLAGNYAPGSVTVGSDSAPCYCAGTLIATDTGERPVESLAIGNRVLTLSGALQPIRWLGRRSYRGAFVRGRRDILPICIRAGALGSGLPRRDLHVSPLHAMWLDGGLVPAENLVNGVSITQTDAVNVVHYIHVELDQHDVILAEGAPSETFLDEGNRGMFHNAHEFAALYGERPRGPARYCAPRWVNGEDLEAVKRDVDLRAGLYVPGVGETMRGSLDGVHGRTLHGWAQNPDRPDIPVCLDLMVDGEMPIRTLANLFRPDLLAAGVGNGRHGFAVHLPALGRWTSVRRVSDGLTLGELPATGLTRRICRAA